MSVIYFDWAFSIPLYPLVKNTGLKPNISNTLYVFIAKGVFPVPPILKLPTQITFKFDLYLFIKFFLINERRIQTIEKGSNKRDFNFEIKSFYTKILVC